VKIEWKLIGVRSRIKPGDGAAAEQGNSHPKRLDLFTKNNQ